jgi:hypothetical protein
MTKPEAIAELSPYGLHLRKRQGAYSVKLVSPHGAPHIIVNDSLQVLVREAKILAFQIGIRPKTFVDQRQHHV